VAQSGDPIDEILMLRLAGLRGLGSVLLESLKKVLDGTVWHENGGQVDGRNSFKDLSHLDRNNFNAFRAILQGFQFQLGSGRAFELDIQARLGSMNLDASVGPARERLLTSGY
jgi:hypothetical protein